MQQIDRQLPHGLRQWLRAGPPLRQGGALAVAIAGEVPRRRDQRQAGDRYVRRKCQRQRAAQAIAQHGNGLAQFLHKRCKALIDQRRKAKRFRRAAPIDDQWVEAGRFEVCHQAAAGQIEHMRRVDQRRHDDDRARAGRAPQGNFADPGDLRAPGRRGRARGLLVAGKAGQRRGESRRIIGAGRLQRGEEDGERVRAGGAGHGVGMRHCTATCHLLGQYG